MKPVQDTAPVTTSFSPGTDDTRVLRDAFGRFATGVTIVTTQSANGPLGITANSFSSVSLEPPLLLWSPARASRRFEAFATATHFAIHVLGDGQMDLCKRFSQDGFNFEGLDWQASEAATPLLPDCLARFECAHHASHDGGDHLVILGRVLGAEFADGAPLLFNAGTYGGFAPAT